MSTFLLECRGMLSYKEITPRTYIVLDGEPYEVLSSQITRKQRQKPSNQTRLRNLLRGNVIERTFHQSDTVPEALLETQTLRYLYNHRDEYWFSNPLDSRERLKIDTSLISNKHYFLKENNLVDILYFNNKPIDIKFPIKVDLKVSEAPPSLRGDTAQGGTKQVTLETGAVITTPLFINIGDTVRVNTETGEYVERVSKS